MGEPIENAYFDWLCAKVLSVKVPIYFDLIRVLFQTEFIWIIPGDRNREADGKELRVDFLREAYLKKDSEWCDEPCSVLEVLIAFAKRCSFQTDDPAREWFWTFMTNLELDEFRQVADSDIPLIEEILNTFIWRTYDDNGHGGLSPLRWPKEDQRKVEIWYQWCALVDENEMI